jgi:hypothetical protein
LVILKTGKRKRYDVLPNVYDQQKHWTEVDIGKVRFFVRRNHVPKHQDNMLEPSPSGMVLSSPSRRDPARQAANALSSRGHGLITSRPDEFITLLKLIAARPGYPDAAFINSLPLDKQSRTLLELILRSDNE